jgi:hypothetical protein
VKGNSSLIVAAVESVQIGGLEQKPGKRRSKGGVKKTAQQSCAWVVGGTPGLQQGTPSRARVFDSEVALTLLPKEVEELRIDAEQKADSG